MVSSELEGRMSDVRKGLFLGLALFVAPLLGCGPIESTAVISDASVALSGAKTAEGDKYAPYEYTSAELFLQKAREERGYADYEVAIDYARKSRDFARQAQAKSLKRVREGVEDAGAAFSPELGGNLNESMGAPGSVETLPPPPLNP